MGQFSHLVGLADEDPYSTTDGASKKPVDGLPPWAKAFYDASQLPTSALETGVSEAFNTMSAGATGAGLRYGGAATKSAAEGIPFADALKLMGENVEAARTENPLSALTGQIAGGVGLGAGATKAAGAALPALMATRQGMTPAMARIAAAGVGGGALNSASELGAVGADNTDSIMDFITGAAGGAGGQAILGEALPKAVSGVRKFLGRSSTKEATADMAESMVAPASVGRRDRLNTLLDNPEGMSGSFDDLADSALALPSSKLFGEANEDFQAIFEALSGSPHLLGGKSSVKNAMQNRVEHAVTDAEALIANSFAPSSSRAQAYKQFTTTRSKLNDDFSIAMHEAETRGEALAVDSIKDAVESAFERQPGGRTLDLQERALRLVDEFAEDGALAPSAVQDLKTELDAIVHSYSGAGLPGAAEAPGIGNLKRLATKIKSGVDEQLLDLAPELAPVRASMRENFANNSAMGSGFDAMKKLKMDPHLIKDEYEALSTAAEKSAYEMGMLQAITEDAVNKGEGGLAILKKVFKGQTREMERLRAVFPENVIREFETNATELVGNLSSAKAVEGSRKAAMKQAVTGADPSGSSILDLGTIARPLMQMGGTTQGVVGARRLATKPDVQFQTNLMDLLSLPGPAAARTIRELEKAHGASRSAGGFKSGAAGATAGATLLDNYFNQ